MFGLASLVIGIKNPIYSLLILIFLFVLGSGLLFVLQLEYFSLLFIIVYVGVIVVLFLFIVMMLEIKIFNVSQKITDLFYYRSWILIFFFLEIFLFFSQDFFDLISLFTVIKETQLVFHESNLYIDYSLLLQRTDHLRGLGNILFTEYKIALILASLLLLLSMIGSIVMTLDNSIYTTLKQQNANVQSLRNSNFLGNSFKVIN